LAHIYRGSSRLNEANTNTWHGLSVPGHTGSHTDLDSTPSFLHMEILDDTGSTASTDITFTLKCTTAGADTIYTNRVSNSNPGRLYYETGTSEITIMEIGA
jgi:hypothetical protein